jgi:TonB family protein
MMIGAGELGGILWAEATRLLPFRGGSGRMNKRLISITVLLLFLPGCSRQRDQRTAEANREPSHIASLPSAGSSRPESLARVPSEDQTLNRPPISRPSPFSGRPKPEFEQPSRSRSIPAPPSAEAPPGRPKIEAKAHVSPKPPKLFTPPVADSSASPISPAPPSALPVIIEHPAPALLVVPKICCAGEATVEPAPPARIHRLLGKIPGLRRIHQNSETAEGYVAPRPAHEIRLVLPPKARAALKGGTMDLRAFVDKSGRVTRVQLLSPKNEELVDVAASAATNWPFAPAKLNDVAIPSEVILHFTFGGN